MRALDSRGHAWRLFDGSDGVLRAQGEPDGYCGGWLSTAPLLEAKPDPKDGPTKGGFLDAVREKLGLPSLCILRDRSGRWYPFDMGSDAPVHGHEFLKDVGGSSEFSALEAAWKAAP